MRRREFIAGLGGAVAWPLAALAQQPQKLPTIGYLVAGTAAGSKFRTAAFLGKLRELGWVEGRNLRIDYRFAGGDRGRLAAYAEELVNLQPDVIFVYSRPTALAVRQYTSVIPIVFGGSGDPALGLVRNVARPEGNVTGFANWGEACRGAGGWSCSRRPCLAFASYKTAGVHCGARRREGLADCSTRTAGRSPT